MYFKLKNDPRILKGVGFLLRKSSLDELPQLWNVVLGEMSLVGPRPFPHYHLEQFSQEFRNLRRSVIPGMTGLWQVLARSDGNLETQEKLDTYYIRNWSIWLDLSLLGRTALVVLTGKGAY
jgi:lipopolysaccharide/colanic/teichoic acid biosynthesis glycosyltransferase